MEKTKNNIIERECMGKKVHFNKGKKLSEEHKKKIGLANSVSVKEFHKRNPEFRKTMNERFKGVAPWNKGRTGIYSEETRKKMSEAAKGHPSWNRGRKFPQFSGKNHPMYGKNHTEETRKKMSEAKKGKPGKKLSRESRIKISEKLKNHPCYKDKERGINISRANKGRISPMKGKNHSVESIKKIKIARAKQVFPLKDSSIELKIQDFLTLLEVEFVTHKYMNIEHSYQCDILIPVQDGISQKTIIECDGDFFHMNPNIYSPEHKMFKNGMKAKDKWKLDKSRTKELIEKGYRVIRIWENEIKVMDINQFKEKIITGGNENSI